jgi:hypothetical protein
MTQLLDGLATGLSEMFGEPVTLLTAGAEPQLLDSAIVRERPIEVAGEQGGFILIEQPTLRVCRNIAPYIERGDEILLADGRLFRVESRIATSSPASDAFIVCTLERVT